MPSLAGLALPAQDVAIERGVGAVGEGALHPDGRRGIETLFFAYVFSGRCRRRCAAASRLQSARKAPAKCWQQGNTWDHNASLRQRLPTTGHAAQLRSPERPLEEAATDKVCRCRSPYAQYRAVRIYQ